MTPRDAVKPASLADAIRDVVRWHGRLAESTRGMDGKTVTWPCPCRPGSRCEVHEAGTPEEFLRAALRRYRGQS